MSVSTAKYATLGPVSVKPLFRRRRRQRLYSRQLKLACYTPVDITFFARYCWKTVSSLREQRARRRTFPSVTFGSGRPRLPFAFASPSFCPAPECRSVMLYSRKPLSRSGLSIAKRIFQIGRVVPKTSNVWNVERSTIRSGLDCRLEGVKGRARERRKGSKRWRLFHLRRPYKSRDTRRPRRPIWQYCTLTRLRKNKNK